MAHIKQNGYNYPVAWQKCDEIVQDSYDYLNRKIDLSDHDRVILKKILKSSLHRLLKEPIEELKMWKKMNSSSIKTWWRDCLACREDYALQNRNERFEAGTCPVGIC